MFERHKIYRAPNCLHVSDASPSQTRLVHKRRKGVSDTWQAASGACFHILGFVSDHSVRGTFSYHSSPKHPALMCTLFSYNETLIMPLCSYLYISTLNISSEAESPYVILNSGKPLLIHCDNKEAHTSPTTCWEGLTGYQKKVSLSVQRSSPDMFSYQFAALLVMSALSFSISKLSVFWVVFVLYFGWKELLSSSYHALI